MPQVASKVTPAGTFKVVDADQVEETAAAKIMTSEERAKIGYMAITGPFDADDVGASILALARTGPETSRVEWDQRSEGVARVEWGAATGAAARLDWSKSYGRPRAAAARYERIDWTGQRRSDPTARLEWSSGGSAIVHPLDGHAPDADIVPELFHGRVQSAMVMGEQDGQDGLRGRHRLTWAGKADGVSAWEAVGGGFWRGRDVFGHPTLQWIMPGFSAVGQDPTDLTILFRFGQSLQTKRCGPGAGAVETWPADVEYQVGTEVDDAFLSFSRVWGAGNSNPGTDESLENIGTENFQVAQMAISDPVAPEGISVISDASHFCAAINLRYAALRRPGLGKVFLATYAIGGDPIDVFLPPADGGSTTFWDEVLVPALQRIKAQADALGYTVRRVAFDWNQHEQDHAVGTSYIDYKADHDALIAATRTATNAIFGGGVEFYFIGSGGARIYEENHVGVPAGFEQFQVSAPRMVQIDAGLSDAAGYEDVYHSFPEYDDPFSGVSHKTQLGYYWEDAKVGAMLAYAIWQREVLGAAKAKPMHVNGAVLSSDSTTLRVTWHMLPWSRGLTQGPDPAPSPYTGLPAKADEGFSFHGGDATPTVASVVTDAAARMTTITFTEPWTGTGRRLGVAFQAEGTMSVNRRQGWNSTTFDPGGAWRHMGPASTIRAASGFCCPFTGHHLPQRPVPQLIDIAD